MFPGGRPGVGLLILRGCLVGAVVSLHTALSQVVAAPPAVLDTTAIFLGVAVAVGLLTPVSMLLIVLGGVGVLVCGAEQACVAAGAIAVAIAVFLLGPGAYSVDARLYGRRVICQITWPP